MATAGTQYVDGLAMRDRDQPCLGIGVIGQARVGAQRSQERLRPRVLSIVGTEDYPAYPQHGSPVLLHDPLERLLHDHIHADASASPGPACRYASVRLRPESASFLT